MNEQHDRNEVIAHHTNAPILVVEDSMEDFEVLEYACNKADVDIPLLRCKDGQDALQFLYNEDQDNRKSTYSEPILILLDLNYTIRE